VSERITIRRAEERDEARWRELWDGYCKFYERAPNQPVADHTWSRIMDPAAAVHAIVAERTGEGVIGIANYLLHENTATLTPVCYLQDLYVDPDCRATGVGKGLIDWLYWNTRANNYRARGLYDKYGQESGFVRYVVANPASI